MPTYSFLDVHGALIGPGGVAPFGGTQGNSQEGIAIEPTGDKNVMTVGAGGVVMHNLKGDKSATVTINCLRTSPLNAILWGMYNFQTASARYHGKNVLAITNVASGDAFAGREVAFAKAPSNTYAEEGGIVSWALHVGYLDGIFGSYDK